MFQYMMIQNNVTSKTFNKIKMFFTKIDRLKGHFGSTPMYLSHNISNMNFI